MILPASCGCIMVCVAYAMARLAQRTTRSLCGAKLKASATSG
jgi:hypothetical protein